MPGMPELPVSVPHDQKQVRGTQETEPIYQTHRGKQAKSRNVGDLPPRPDRPNVALRYEEEQ